MAGKELGGPRPEPVVTISHQYVQLEMGYVVVLTVLDRSGRALSWPCSSYRLGASAMKQSQICHSLPTYDQRCCTSRAQAFYTLPMLTDREFVQMS